MATYQHCNSRLRRAFEPIVLLVLAAEIACVPILHDDGCGPTFRSEQTEAPLRDAAGTDLGKGIITVAETRDSQSSHLSVPGIYPRSITLTLMGPGYGSHGGPLKGNVTGVLLTDATGAVRLDIPVVPPPLNGDEIISTAVIPIDDIATFSALERAMVDGTVRLHMETSAGAPAVMDLSFAAVPLGNWGQAHCS